MGNFWGLWLEIAKNVSSIELKKVYLDKNSNLLWMLDGWISRSYLAIFGLL
jgi:hypothetical protein